MVASKKFRKKQETDNGQTSQVEQTANGAKHQENISNLPRDTGDVTKPSIANTQHDREVAGVLPRRMGSDCGRSSQCDDNCGKGSNPISGNIEFRANSEILRNPSPLGLGIQETIKALLNINCPPLPVAPKQEPRKSWKQWNGREVYAHHAQFIIQRAKGQTVICDGERVTVSGDYCRISFTKILGEDAPIKGDLVRLDENLNPIPRFTGKNPSYLDKNGIPRTLNHGEYQKRLPTREELNKWFANPNNGIGTLGGHAGVDWIDFDAKNYPSQEECDRAVQGIRDKLPGPTWVEQTGSGGYRIAVKPKQKPTFTNFATTPGGDHVGEALFEGRFTVLAPSIHPNGNAYQRLEFSQPIEVESLESIGIYPASDEVATLERKLAREVKVKAKVQAVRKENPQLSEAHAREQVEREINAPTNPQDNPWDIRNFATYFEGYTEKGEWAYAKCPHHHGTSLTSLRVNLHTGAVKAWCGCDVKDVYQSGLKLASDLGFKILTDQNPDSRKSKEISKSQWWERFGEPRTEEKNESQLLAAIQKLFRRGKKRKEKAIADETEFLHKLLVDEHPTYEPENIITYSPNAIPDLIEWWRQGKPTIRYKPEQLKDLQREAKDKGYKFTWDSSYCGAGKNHLYGQLTHEDLGIDRSYENEEEKKDLGALILLSEDPRNPTVGTIEDRYTAPLVKHNGLVADPTRQTPSGRIHLKRSTAIEHDELSSDSLAENPSCIHSASFAAAAERGYPLRAGKKSEVCKLCKRFDYCQIINNPDPEESGYQAYHPLAFSSPSPKSDVMADEARNTLPDSNIFVAHRSDIERANTHIERKSLAVGDHKTHLLAKIFIHSLLDGMDEFTPDNKRYGADHRESVNKIIIKPLIGQSTEIDAAVPAGTEGAIAVEDYWGAAGSVRWYKPTTVSDVKERVELSDGQIIWVDSFKFRTGLALQSFLDKIWELYADNWINLKEGFKEYSSIDPLDCSETFVRSISNSFGEYKRVRVTDTKGNQKDKIEISPIIPDLNEVRGGFTRYLHSEDEQLFEKSQSPSERLQAIEEKTFYNWLNPLLSILSPEEGSGTAHLRATCSTLNVTRPSYRVSNNIKKAGYSMLLDATIEKRDLEALLKLSSNIEKELTGLDEELSIAERLYEATSGECCGETIEDIKKKMRSLIQQQQILQVEQERPEYKNLISNTYSNLGKVTRDRFCRDKKSGDFNVLSRYASGNRIQALTTQIIDQALALGKKVGIIDAKNFILGIEIDGVQFSPYANYKDNPNVKLGWWFNDHVGSNRFKDVDVLLLVGKPNINLGQLAAEWQCRTGQIVSPSNPTGKFAAYVERVMLGELEQAVSRPRAHRRPDKQIEVHLIDEYSPDELAYLEAKFPGMGLQLNRTEDVCIEAATKGTQLTTQFDTIIKKILELGDIAKTTAVSVGKSLGVSHGRISQLCKEQWGIGFGALKTLLISLLEIPNRETNGPIELSEDEKWIAEWYLPHLVEGWREGHLEVDMVDEFVSLFESFGAKAFRRIIEGSPPDARAILTSSLFETLPISFLEKIKDYLSTDPEFAA